MGMTVKVTTSVASSCMRVLCCGAENTGEYSVLCVESMPSRTSGLGRQPIRVVLCAALRSSG